MAQAYLNKVLTTMEVAENVADIKHQGAKLLSNDQARHMTSEMLRKESKDYKDAEIFDSSEILD